MAELEVRGVRRAPLPPEVDSEGGQEIRVQRAPMPPDVEEASVHSETLRHSMPSPEEIERPARNNKYNIWIILGLLAVVVTGTTCGVVFGLKAEALSDVENAGSSLISSSGRKREIKLQRYFVKYNVSSYQAFEDEDSPQYKAIQFLAYDDRQELSAPTKDLRSKDAYSLLTRYVMSVLYYALDGPKWNFDLMFLSYHDTCYWFSIFQPPIGQLGVICNENTNEITGISFIGDKMKGNLPKEISHLTTLSYMEFIGNDVRGTIPAEFSSLTSLRTMVFTWNQLSGDIPAWIGDLSRLEFLYLANNLFTGTVPLVIEELENLKVLALNDNGLDGPVDMAWRLQKLEYLFIEDNLFTGELPPMISNTSPKLINLDVSKNDLVGPLPIDLFQLTSIEILDFHGNAFNGSVPSAEGVDFSPLEFLALHQNKIEGQIPASLSNLKTLQHIDLSENRLGGVIPNLSNLTNMEYFFLAENNLAAGSIPDFLFDYSYLRELSLKNTNRAGSLSDGLRQGSGWKSLVVLDLDNNFLSGEIPAEFGDLQDLEFLLLNRNQFSSTLPADLENLTNLRMALFNGNGVTGSFNPICNIATLEVAVSDCMTTSCDCCTTCCDENVTASENCHDYGQVAQLDPSWDRGYNRTFFAFSQTQGFEHTKETPKN